MGEAQERLVDVRSSPRRRLRSARVANGVERHSWRRRRRAAGGTRPRVVAAAGPRGAFPLATSLAGRYALRRLALVGDAAHQVHPLGGQGVNLGMRDVVLLTDALAAACANGGDVGSMLVLRKYADEANGCERADDGGAGRVAEAVRVGPAAGGVGEGRGAGGVNALGPIRRRIARYAMGGGVTTRKGRA